MLENLFYQEQDKSMSVAKETVGIVISLQHMRTIIRLRHMRCAIACTCLFACLKYWRQAKKSTPCLIKKASRYVAGRTSKTTTFFAFTFCKTKILQENHVYLLFHWFSGENCIIRSSNRRCSI